MVETALGNERRRYVSVNSRERRKNCCSTHAQTHAHTTTHIHTHMSFPSFTNPELGPGNDVGIGEVLGEGILGYVR